MQNIFNHAKLIPIITLNSFAEADHILTALRQAGMTTFELVLRTPNALTIITEIIQKYSDCQIGVGTVINCKQVEQVKRAGAQFIASPGCSSALLDCAKQHKLAFLPGVATPSDILQVLDQGVEIMKLFPAALLGGIQLLKSYRAIFPQVKFCPTGGITLQNLRDYWQQPNVIAIGGSWLVPNDYLQSQNWDGIIQLAQQSVSLLQS